MATTKPAPAPQPVDPRAAKINPDRFFQLMREDINSDYDQEVLINSDHVVAVRKHKDGRCTVVMADNTVVVPLETYDDLLVLLVGYMPTFSAKPAPTPVDK